MYWNFNYFADVIPAFVGTKLMVSFRMLVHHTQDKSLTTSWYWSGEGMGVPRISAYGVSDEQHCALHGIHCGFLPNHLTVTFTPFYLAVETAVS